MKKSYESFKDTLYIGPQTDKGIFRLGTLSLVITSNGKHCYEFDIDESRYEQALKLSESNMLPGFDPMHGWKQRHDKEIYFVYERTFHPGRPDLDEILKPYGMKASEYNKWAFLKLTGGLFGDKWRVTQDFSKTY
jgi:hypothetical protein